MNPTKVAFFGLAILVFVMALCVEIGLGLNLPAAASGPVPAEAEAPGLGIRYLGILDAALAYTLCLLALEFFAPQAIVGRVQGLATLLLAIIGLIASVALILAAIAVLMLMVSLLLAPPFGPLAYLAAFGTFPAGEARAILGGIMALKIAGAILLLLASPSFLANWKLMLLIGLSIGLTFLVGLLIGFVPSFLASITDALGAIVAGIVGAVWILLTLVFSLPAILRAIRSLLPV